MPVRIAFRTIAFRPPSASPTSTTTHDDDDDDNNNNNNDDSNNDMKVPVRVAFRKPDAAAGRYTVTVMNAHVTV